ncbi:response regulator [Magnetovibrio sp.]|uniref:response regulator n=1 Tax=Magnetovibrio sp. TaxID=2024836 RepID=UPI002F92C782
MPEKSNQASPNTRTPGHNEVDAILARLRVEFIENTRDQLDEIETRIDWLESGREISADDLFDVQRNIHNIKGQGATFGFPLVGRVAHLFEDYLENVGGVKIENIKDLRTYIETMANLLISGENFTPPQTEELLRSLPMGRATSFTTQKVHDVEVLLVMPAGLQRRLVATELLSCGFHVNRAYDSMEALAYALDITPDIVFANYDMTPFNGCELARVFGSIERLQDIHFVLCTSYKQGDAHLRGLPKNVSVVEKRRNYTESLSTLLMEWGVFGHMAS